MKTKLHTILISLTALATASLCQAETAANISQHPRLEKYSTPAFPVSQIRKSIITGYAQLNVLVAADGSVVETYVSAYSHPDFAKSAEDAVASWKFRPDEDQAASPKRYAFRINFEREGLTVVQGDFFEITNNFFPHQRPKTEVVTARLKDLDAIPEPISFAVPSYPGELKSQRIEGATTVGFYIDEDGMVRVPAIVKSTRPEFATAVLAAIKQWKFAAPTSQGQPTSVHAVQRFIFTPGKPTSTAPAAQ